MRDCLPAIRADLAEILRSLYHRIFTISSHERENSGEDKRADSMSIMRKEKKGKKPCRYAQGKEKHPMSMMRKGKTRSFSASMRFWGFRSRWMILYKWYISIIIFIISIIIGIVINLIIIIIII